MPGRIRPQVPAVAVLLLAFGASALAQDVQVHGTEAEYAAAVGDDVFCIDFDGSSDALVPGDSFSTEVAFGSPEAADTTEVNWSSDALSDAGSTTAPNGVGPVSGVFAATAGAFKFELSSASVAPTVELYDAADALIASVAAPGATGFFGVVSATPVRRFVIRPGVFDPDTGDLDRFFIDDFCVSGPAAEPEPATPSELCAALVAAVEAADPAAFRGGGMQQALLNKLDVICRRIDRGSPRGFRQAAKKLLHDVLPKTDGDPSPGDWIPDATLQQDLEDRIHGLLHALGDPMHGPAGAVSRGNGGGNGRGHGRATGHAHGRNR